MAGRLAGEGAAGGEPAAGGGLRRQSRRRRPRGLGLSRRGDRADGREFRRAAAPPSTRSASPTTSASRSTTSRSTIRPATSRARRRWTRSPAPRPSPSAWRRSPAASTCSASARWGSATRRSRRRSISRCSAARRRIGSGRGTGVDDAGIARKCAAVAAARRVSSRPSRRSPGNAAPARRPRDRRDGRRDPRGAA